MRLQKFYLHKVKLRMLEMGNGGLLDVSTISTTISFMEMRHYLASTCFCNRGPTSHI